MKRLRVSICALVTTVVSAFGQQYAGMSGLIHTPSADMNPVGTARLGVHFISKDMTSNAPVFYHDGKKYNTFSGYLSLTPFKWVEVGYNVTLMRRVHYKIPQSSVSEKTEYTGDGYHEKDQYFSVKFKLLSEKKDKWYPSLAIGGCDFFGASSGTNELYHGNVWLAMAKTVYLGRTSFTDIHEHEMTFNLGCRYYLKDYNKKSTGVFASAAYRPGFYLPLRLIVEANVHGFRSNGFFVNVGADCLLWNHFLVQVALVNGKSFSGGLCYQLNLFGDGGVLNWRRSRTIKNGRLENIY